MQPNRRTARVRELLKHEIAECIRRELSIEEVGLLTVNDVGLASDLRTATVFVGFVGTKEQKKRAPRGPRRPRRADPEHGGAPSD
jgi:ribosome-binding factor A